MSTHFSVVPQGSRDSVDTGSLSWVMGEIREAFARSNAALHDAVAQDAESRTTSLYHAKTHLHQAHGALEIVDIDGVALVTETLEQLLERIASAQIALVPETMLVIENAYQAVVEYLEELLSGAPHQAVRLFPYYKAVQELLGAERIHPADLFFPALVTAPVLPPAEPARQSVPATAALVSLRQRFERALLPFLKHAGSVASCDSTALMRDVIGDIAQMQADPQAYGAWWVLHGFAEAAAAGQLRSERHVKQLFALINLQIRRLAQGGSSLSDRVLRDALFFIAQAEKPSPLVRQIRDAYALDGQVPDDYERRRYGQIDADALRSAKERLAQAKGLWNRIAGGEANLAESFEGEMQGLRQAGEQLHSASLFKLLRELNGLARHAAHSNPGDSICLEMATSLLFVENALDHINRLSEDFSARADALTARLLSIVAGETPVESAQWLDELSEQAQQRQTMTVLAAEMQASLRQVEKTLDDYFYNPEKCAELAQIEPILHQIAGILAMLDQNDAMRAVQHTQRIVQRFAQGSAETTLDQGALKDVAQNIGALGFFIEMLPTHPETAKNHFSFNEEQGLFHARLFEKNTPYQPLSIPEEADAAAGFGGLPGDAAGPVLPYADSAEASAVMPSEAEQPMLQEQQEIAPEPVFAAAAADADHALAAPAMPDQRELPVASQIAAVDAGNALALPESEAAMDVELRDIFISEAEEVLACAKETVPQSRVVPHNQEHLATLRRSFHTLKGSGRMVGLSAFGDAGWAIEQVLNLWLAEARTGTADLYALLEMANEELDAWVAEIRMHGYSARTPQALASAAERVKMGEPLGAEMAESSNDAPAADSIASAVEQDDIQPASSEQDQALCAEHVLSATEVSAIPDIDTAAAEPVPVLPSSTVIEFPGMTASALKNDDNVKRIGNIEISVPLHNIYLAETDEIVRLLAQDFSEWRHESYRAVTQQALNAAHSLAGSSATVGFAYLHDIAHTLEMLLQQLARQPVALLGSEYDTLEQCVQRCRLMLQKFALAEMPPAEPEQVMALERIRVAVLRRVESKPAEAAIPTFDAEISLDFGPDLELDLDLDDVAGESAPESEQIPAAAIESMPEPELVPAAMFESTPEPQQTPTAAVESTLEPAQTSAAPFESAADAAAAVEDPAFILKDELDADLLPVFIEEGCDLFPQIGQALRDWQKTPEDGAAPHALLRFLHTVKGSARMAGAMILGQHVHRMESQIESLMHAGSPSAAALDEMLARHDYSLTLFEQLQQAPATPAVTTAAADSVAEVDTFEAVPLPAMSNAASAPLVRVRADIIDRMVNQAGEVSISRSKLETEVGAMRLSLSELTENVARLRSQLREIEMQAETQIMSLMPQSGDREFDPLEFDRFTRLQELTRMMAESVDDVAMVQQSLNRTIDAAATDLSSQARLTRDLQQDLMRVRMVPFASIAERLYRVTRQTAKEVDKRVNLDIHGASVELDRGVLEKMAEPLGHLLRNAIVHGIESREERRAADKSDTGELRLEIRQEGNEVVLRFSDDGQGLNLARIREKAKMTGLLTHDQVVSDVEAVDLIFRPGFTTAAEITELAGRGVGMDVVHSEVAALGGRIAIESEAGRGARFTIHLPLTLAVTQVVLLSTGGNTYAVPSALVEQVQQLKSNALAAAYNDGAIAWQGKRVALHYLPTLLGDAVTAPVAQQYSPVIILKSGNDRVAIHVDEVIGNREVVVKNIGPQLARMIGIAGATVLGSGEIILILNPVPLALRAVQADLRAPRVNASDAQDGIGAVAEMSAAAIDVGDAGGSQPIQGLRTQNIVMVVDDSLTVRRVTQRLLAREGYQVVLAKDGVDALQQLQTITPDVMLVDIEMPRMDGFDLTRNVRSDERTRDIPIIMITSRTADKHRNYAKELGVNAYFGKPYQETALLESITGFIRKVVPVA